MSKKLTYEQKRRRYVREQLKLHLPLGSELVLYGSIIVLLWALGELNASYTFIKAWFKTDQKIIELGYISAREYFTEVILKTPEAVDALKQLAVLCLGIVSGIIGIVLRKRRISGLMIVIAVIVAFYEVPTPFWLSAVSYTRYIKLAGCALLFTGGVSKIATRVVRRKTAKEQYDLKHKKNSADAVSSRRDRTLIPERRKNGK